MASNIISISDFASGVSASAGGSIPYQAGSSALALEESLVNNGFTVIDGAVSQATSTIVNGTEIVTNQAMGTSLTGANLNITQLESATTAGGTNIAKGGMAMKVSPLYIVGGVLAGCGIGWQLYNEYPEFWTNISDKVFGGKILLVYYLS